MALPVLAWWAYGSHLAVPVWRSEVTLWTHAAAVSPGSVRARRNLAKALFASGSEDEARTLLARDP